MKRTILIALVFSALTAPAFAANDPIVMGDTKISADSITQKDAVTTFNGHVKIELGNTVILLKHATMTKANGQTYIDGTKEGGAFPAK